MYTSLNVLSVLATETGAVTQVYKHDPVREIPAEVCEQDQLLIIPLL